MRIEIFPRIERDLDEITEYIARDNPTRAISFVAELRMTFRQIGRNPEGYRLRQDAGPGMRIAPYGNYLIVFRITEKVVEIRRFVHGARDLRNVSLR